jgi:hypothetical protein
MNYLTMNTTPIKRFTVCAGIGMLFASALAAQTPATDPMQLAKYDANKNGRLDPEEVAVMEAAQRNATRAVTTSSNSESSSADTVVLSPFEVVSDGRGY